MIIENDDKIEQTIRLIEFPQQKEYPEQVQKEWEEGWTVNSKI